MDLFELLQGQLFNQNTLEELASETQAEPQQVEKLTKLAIPTMLEALRKNASTEEGKLSLERALDDHQQDPTDLLGFLRGADQNDGAKILNHMFGSQKDQVSESLAASSGMNLGSVIGLLTKYAPMILSLLAFSKLGKKSQPAPQPKSTGIDIGDIFGQLTGKKEETQSRTSGFDLNDVLGDLTGRAQAPAQNDNEGGLMDSLKDILGGFLK